jgi:hypothetical protein
MDTINDSLVSLQGEMIIILRPTSRLPKEKALRLAAWIVALAGEDEKFLELLQAIRNS